MYYNLMSNFIEQYSFWNKRISTKVDEIIIIDFSDVDHLSKWYADLCLKDLEQR